MPMTVIVTNNAPERVRGFLSSVACEIAPGVYTSPRMTVAVRDRVWAILAGWFPHLASHSVLMTWPASDQPGGQAIRVLGLPRTEIVDHHGIFFAWREPGPFYEPHTLTTESDNTGLTDTATEDELTFGVDMDQDHQTPELDPPAA